MAETRRERTPGPDPAPLDDATVESPVIARGRQGWHVRLFGSAMFFRLWLSQVVSATGDWLGFLAITALATDVGAGSPGAAVGVVMAARIVPGFFLGPLAGVLIDRWDRKKVMVVCDLGRAAAFVALPFVETVLALVAVSFVLEVFTLVRSPAKEASVPNLVPQEHLTTANSLSLVAAYATMPLAAGFFAVLAGVASGFADNGAVDALRLDDGNGLAFYTGALAFVASAVMVSTLELPGRLARRSRRGTLSAGARMSQTFAELKEGWHFIFLNPVARAVNVGLATGLIGGGMLVPLGPVFSQQVLGAGDAGFGLFIFSLGVGVAVGVVALSVFQARLPKGEVFVGAVFGAGASLLVAASMSSLTAAATAVAVLGICAGAVYVLGFTLLHESVADEMRGRIFSALYTLVRLCLLIAFAVGPFLSEALGRLSNGLVDGELDLFGLMVAVPGVRLTLWLAAVIILVAGVLALRSMRPEPDAEADTGATSGDDGRSTVAVDRSSR